MPSLYLNGYKTHVKLESKRLLIERRGDDGAVAKRMEVRIGEVDRAIFVGRVRTHVEVIARLLAADVPVSFVSGRGKFLGTACPPHNGSAMLRIRQYELAQNRAFARTIAGRLVHAKIRNSRRVLQRLAAGRDVPPADVRPSLGILQKLAERTQTTCDLHTLRGFEGYAGRVYFQTVGHFFPPAFPFGSRSRRPPADPANALLSWTYTILLSECLSAIQAAGLDPCLGFLHGLSYGRPSLALDLLEPYRAPMADLLALHLLNHGLLRAEHFDNQGGEAGCTLKPDGRSVFFAQYEQGMQREFTNARSGGRTTFRACLREDVAQLVAAMQGKQPFEPFLVG